MTAAKEFLNTTAWKDAAIEPITGDASARRYFRVKKAGQTAVLMDASRVRETIAPFGQINFHLQQLGFSVPTILTRDDENGFLLLEDFGDETFSHLLERGRLARELETTQHAGGPPALLSHFDPEKLFTLATDVLIALHQHPQAIPTGLRAYHPQKMQEDIQLFLEVHPVSDKAKAEFKAVWLEALPLAHQVPVTLLLRDYHAANLLLLPGRIGIRQAGLLDFQDAYQGPVTYDLVSLLEDARRDLPRGLKKKMIAHYFAQFPALDRQAFETSLAILAALRHTRVLAVFEKLSRDGKPAYKKLHSPRVQRLLQAALCHPTLAGVKQWFDRYARQN